MKSWLCIVALSCAPTLLWAQPLQCGVKIIDEGATSAEVADACGPPVQVDHGTVSRGSAIAVRGQPAVIAGSSVEVATEVWTYNFGPNQLMQRVRFEDGIVVRIDSLGYGF